MIEHRARIQPADRFEAGSFRSIDLAPGIRGIIGRPHGKDTTETQAIAFDSRMFTLPQVRSWLRRHGYRWTRIDVADEAEKSNPPIPNRCSNTTTNPDPIGDAADANANAPGPKRRNPPAPRQLVQIGTLRGLEFADGTRMEWSVRERWPLLADPGAEKGSRGRLRLYAVPPSPRHRSEHEPHKTSARTFETWHDFQPRQTYTLDVPLADEFRTPLGRVKAIIYRSDKWQPGRAVDYIHRFTAGAEPEASAKGERTRPEAVQLAGGAWRLTARGLVG